MPKISRLNAIGVAKHVTQRGNNRQTCFGSEQDFAAYAHWLKKYSNQFSVKMHAWIFMTNHIHPLVTSYQSYAVSKMMQSIGRHYAQYFNQEELKVSE